MSAISGFINTIQNAVYGEQVRSAIVSAIEQCYSDVENPSLQTDAFSAAIEEAYADGFLDIQEKSTIAGMTNQKIIYRYTGNEAGYVNGALYYYNGTKWSPIGSAIQTVSNASLMTDQGVIYKYIGNQSGYIKNALYYYDGSSFVPIAKEQTASIATLATTSFELGSLSSSGLPTDSTTRVRSTDFINVNGKNIEIIFPSGISGFVFEYNDSNAFIKDSNLRLSGSVRYHVTGSKIKLLLRNEAGDDTITVSDCDSLKLYLIQNETTNKYRIKATMEYGTLDDSGSLLGVPICYIAYLYRQRSAFFIKTNNAREVTIDDIYLKDLSSISVFFYDATMTGISYVSQQGRNVAIPGGAAYIKIVVTCNNELQNMSLTFNGATAEPTEEKNTFPKSLIVSSLPINYKVGNYHNFVNILLPPNYDPLGTPVPMVVFCHAAGSLVNWGGTMSDRTYLKYLADSGFAVVEFYSWTTKYYDLYGTSLAGIDPYCLPITIDAYNEGVKWFLSRFNIDENNINILGKSTGGEFALYYLMHQPFKIRSIGLFSPVASAFAMKGGGYDNVNRAIAAELKLVGDIENDFIGKQTWDPAKVAFWENNLDKANYLHPSWQGLIGQTIQDRFTDAIADCQAWWANKTSDQVYNNYNLYKLGFVPVKIWGTPTDTQTPYQAMVELVKRLENGGCEASLRTFETGGHLVTDSGAYDAGAVESDVTTSLGVHYQWVPTAYVELLEWILSINSELEPSSN